MIIFGGSEYQNSRIIFGGSENQDSRNRFRRIQQIGVTEMIIFGGSENIWIQNIWGVRKSKFKKSIQADTTDRSNRDDYIWGVRISNMITQIFNIIIFGGSENLNLRN